MRYSHFLGSSTERITLYIYVCVCVCVCVYTYTLLPNQSIWDDYIQNNTYLNSDRTKYAIKKTWQVDVNTSTSCAFRCDVLRILCLVVSWTTSWHDKSRKTVSIQEAIIKTVPLKRTRPWWFVNCFAECSNYPFGFCVCI